VSRTEREPVLSLRGVSKSFGGVRALVDVDVDVHEHEVLAVVGDNGAGKSTLAGVVAGAFRPDAGQVLLDGEPVVLGSPKVARALGIGAVFQDLALVDDLDVVENVFLGQETLRGPFLDEIAMEREAWGLLDQLAAALAKGDKGAAEKLATASSDDTKGNRKVPSVLLTPQLITKDNVKTVIDEGQVKASEVCVAATQSACGQLGIQ